MQASKLKVMAVRLPESELRRVKTLAVIRGVSLQEAVHQALEAWSGRDAYPAPDSLDTLQGSLADVDTEALLKRERALELAKEQRWS